MPSALPSPSSRVSAYHPMDAPPDEGESSPEERDLAENLAGNLAESPAEGPTSLSRLAATAQSLASLRHDFVTSASHEFRTPLTVIASSVGILRDFGDSLDQDRRQLHFDRIQMAIQQVTQLLDNMLMADDMLMAHEVVEETVDCHPQAVDIVAWYRAFIDELQQVNPQRTIHLEIKANGSSIRALDERLLRQILGNLFSNALKYSPPDTAISTTLRLEEHKLTVNIIDQGRGIPDSDQKQIFQPFFRGSNTGHVAGLGLGLSMAQACVIKHAGTLTIDSVEGVGTRICLELPVPSHLGASHLAL